jgi:hypothetical protein
MGFLPEFINDPPVKLVDFHMRAKPCSQSGALQR